MRLRRLAGAILVTALVTTTGVVLAGVRIWQDTRSHVADIETLAAARDGAFRMDVAIRYLNHVRAAPDILRGLVQQARDLTALLDDEPHPETPLVRLHLEEIEHLAASALDEVQGDTDVAPRRLDLLTDQLRIHETGALDALNLVIDDHHREIVDSLRRSLVLLIAMALGLAAAGSLGFALMTRRILHPLGRFAEGIRRFGDGEDSLRITVDRDDELGDIAELVNRAMEQRGAYQRQLRHRIREQQCLYGVLQATTDDSRTVADVCREIARLIPGGVADGDAAVARVHHGAEVFTSGHRAEPLAVRIDSPIRVRGKVVGRVEVAYPDARPDPTNDESPFPDEERTLLDSIAMHLARMIQDRGVREELARSQRLQAVGELTGGIAHDFNNLLTVIQGNAEILLDLYRDRDAETAELAEMIETAAHAAAELTRRLLAFSRRQALEPCPTDINQLIREMQGLLGRTLGEHVEARFSFTPGLRPALIDPSQLETALLNLTVNARDAMPAGGQLTIETADVRLDADYAARRDEVTPGAYVLVAVSDSGTGMPSEVRERIFEPFFTTKQERGTGLGLAMVHGFVKQSGGHVAVYSEPGEGTTVRLYLPRAEAEATAAKKPEPASLPRGDAAVLLVEDDALVRRYAHDQLVALGYRVHTATDGPGAIAFLEGEEHIDLLLTDVVMPHGIDGAALARLAVGLRPELKVLYMSGYTENAIVHHGRLDPGVSLLSKPFRRSELARKVREVLGGAG